ncbi:N-acetylglucosaminyl-diphospho-decaprenol L-rhamnosyltransferase [Gemmata obscuriglobus]|uniref:Glycosyltransferase family 2 protein n=1 Tax=Gemmata obscuriglobus TaxID=114 RepID=A0A2Z3GRZ6_9BACT|nr:glycosyltransferase family 2 protein [Gemmata obscuriglobus]AWM36543.1 glycosyltransferase family 2 protein [Gemmata obscuriglobus]QEG30832.1 N-acetylglucosaminyl-diphospho-decaprenol L-rhamnosyltransferase [Gemmata obscuriglobus]VTS10163.1 Glycosyl transferase family 2 OS=bacterium UASB270 GN=U27_03555 PE=4 SV=1: Glycos_transf_2 [Gemmata obscuriglobus UQM 2246]
MSERTSRKRRRGGNPYAGLIHLLNQRYHAEWQRAELLQNELTGRENSKVARAAEFVRRFVRRFVPHPAVVPKVVTELAVPYTGGARAVPDATVSIIIPFRDRPELLRNCLRSLRRSTYKKTEVVLVDNGSEDPRTARLLAGISAQRNIKLVRCDEPFNFSRLCNLGVRKATGDHLVFLNNDTEVITRRWLERMLVLAADPAVGAVGATLLYPDRTIQHAGLFPRSDGAWVHPYRGEPAEAVGENGELRVMRIVPAVTAACLLVRRDVFESANGFDEDLQDSLNDADLCRRLGAAGRVTVITPHAKLFHYEGLSRAFNVDPLMA